LNYFFGLKQIKVLKQSSSFSKDKTFRIEKEAFIKISKEKNDIGQHLHWKENHSDMHFCDYED